MPTTESENVSIENIVTLSEYEQWLLSKGWPIMANIQTREGMVTVAIATTCSWNRDIRKAIEHERHLPAEHVFCISSTTKNLPERDIGSYKGGDVTIRGES